MKEKRLLNELGNVNDFRQRFYSTHEFFPQFASGLGGSRSLQFCLLRALQPVGSFVICVPFSFHGSVVSDHGNPDTYGRRSVMFLLAEPPSEEAVQHLWGNGFDVFFCCCHHTYAQVMFVDYLPFLLLMLIGVDTAGKRRVAAYPAGGMGTVTGTRRLLICTCGVYCSWNLCPVRYKDRKHRKRNGQA